MRQAPKLTEIVRYPVVAGTALLAIGTTLSWWAKLDISPLFENAMIRRGELWRLASSILPHSGLLHLIFNVYWLWVFGSLVEEVYGHLKAAALLLLFAVVPNAYEFAFADGGIGLSGVGYALLGLLWVLSPRDERFTDAVDSKTIQLFVGWFFICIFSTVTKTMPIANIAHGVGAAVGILTGFAIAFPERRNQLSAALALLLFLGLWGSTAGRPRVNLSATAGYDEGYRGYEALLANRNQEAVRWLQDAVVYQPAVGEYWYNLGIAYQKVGDKKNALAAYRTAAERGNPSAQYYIGFLFESGDQESPKDLRQALEWYRRSAVQKNTDALNALAWQCATNDDPGIRNPRAALDYAREMATLEKEHPDANHLDTLAETYYVNGQYSDAASTERQAIAIASSEQKQKFEEQLEKYQRARVGVKRNVATAKD